MSRSSLAKKLQPAKKALKRFAAKLQSKLHNLNFSKAVRIIKANTNRLLNYCSLHFFLPFKKRSLTKPPYRSHQYDHLYQCCSNKNLLLKNFSPIYIDQLYDAEPTGFVQAKHFHAQAETSSSKGKEVIDEKAVPRKEGKAKEKILCTVEDAWREIVAKSPQLRPVDERAEEFICKFHEEIKLQKDRSNLEFEERLARSA